MAISPYKVWEWLTTKIDEELEKTENLEKTEDQKESAKKKAVEGLIAALEYWSKLDWTTFESRRSEIIGATKEFPEWLQAKNLVDSLNSFDDDKKAEDMGGKNVQTIKELFHQKANRLVYRNRIQLPTAQASEAPASSQAREVIERSTARYRGIGGSELADVGDFGDLGFFGAITLFLLWLSSKALEYAIKKTYKSIVNLFKGKKTLRSWWRLACTLGAGGYMGYIVVAAILAATNPVGWFTIAVAVALVCIAAGIGSFVGKYSAQFFSWMFHRHEVNPSNPDKYRLGKSEVEHYNKRNIRIGNGTEKDAEKNAEKNWRALFTAVRNVHRESGAEDDCNELLDIIHAGNMFDRATVIPIRFQPQWTAFDKKGEPSKLRIVVIDSDEKHDKKGKLVVTYTEKVFTFTRGEEQLPQQSTKKMEEKLVTSGTTARPTVERPPAPSRLAPARPVTGKPDAPARHAPTTTSQASGSSAPGPRGK